MSIKKYTNFDKLNQKVTNEGQFIEDKDFKIVAKGEVEEADFGDCAYDVMEVSVYDINNNLLPQKSGNTIAYIKTGDIKNYLYNTTSIYGKKELAIDVEKLLNGVGFYNGILKVNINFVRSRVGNENELRRVWVQEISPSKKEIRVLPLKTADDKTNELNKKDLNNLSNLNKDFKYYKRSILDSLTSIEKNVLDAINNSLESKFGKDFFNTIRKDFGIKDFNIFKEKIYSDFKESVIYYLENKYYDIKQSNFGKPSELRFINCDQYDFSLIIGEMEKILFNCIEHNSYFLKRRNIDIIETPKEFQIVELVKNTQNNLTAFETPTKTGTISFPPINPPIVVPTQINLPTKPGIFEYQIKNTDSKNTITVKFVNAAGMQMQKYVSPGKSIKVCAQDGTVSMNNIQQLKELDDNPTTILSKKGGVPTPNWEIDKLNLCNTLDIGELSPIVIPTKEIPPKVVTQTPPIIRNQPIPPTTITPVVPTGGGGITREEAAASTNQINTPRGPAISTATAAGQSETLAAFQPITRTDVRQTTITGPTID